MPTKIKKTSLLPLISAFFIFSIVSSAFPSEQSDANALMERCEKEVKGLEVSVKNFGDSADLDTFSKGEQLIKQGKVKFMQTKYTEAKESFNQYLKLQFEVYEALAKKYLERSQQVIDSIAEDLVDFINDKKIVEYLRLANQNLKDANAAMATKHYKNIIDVCRTAKNYAISSYKAAGKAIPDKYKKDAADIEGKIIQEAPAGK